MSNTVPSRNYQNWCITDGEDRDAKNGGNGGGGAPAALDALLVELAPVAADLPAAWAEPEFPPGVKRELARLLIDYVPVRMVVPPGARRQAEVGEPVWQEWTAELAEVCKEL